MANRRDEFTFGESPAVRRMLENCVDFAPSDYPILLTGETGTGKTWLAEHLHTLSGRPGRFIEMPIPQLEDLTLGQLRGNTEGAFTDAKRARRGFLELGSRGTLFLDELDSASPALQTTLLNMVESSEIWPIGAERPVPVDVRMIFATNARRDDSGPCGQLRRDLWYRVNVLQISVPPLRDRPDDIPLLAQSFLRRIARKHGREAPILAGRAIAKLQAAPWPGNLRELDGVLVRAFLRLRGRTSIEAEQIELGSCGPVLASSAELSADQIRTALASRKGNLAATARHLGVNERTFRRNVKELLGPRSQWHLGLVSPGHDRDTTGPNTSGGRSDDLRAAS